MIYTLPCGEDCSCGGEPSWCGDDVPDTLQIEATSFGDGPCQDAGPFTYRGVISSGVNGTLAAITITPHTDGWLADFGTIGEISNYTYDAGSDCNDNPTLQYTTIVTLTLDYTISTGAYILTWTVYDHDTSDPITLAIAEAVCPDSAPPVVNQQTDDFVFQWTAGSVLITL